MILRQHKPKRSKVRKYSVASISIIILTCEIWYLDSAYASKAVPNRMAISQKSVANDHNGFSPFLTGEETTQPPSSPLTKEETIQLPSSPLMEEATSQLPSFPLMGEEKGGGVSKRLDSVCMGSNLCTSICVEKQYKKGGKHEA